VTGSSAANRLAAEADVVLAIGTRLQDFTTGSWGLIGGQTIIGLNVQAFDATKHRALPLVADALAGLSELSADLGNWRAPAAWTATASAELAGWKVSVDTATLPTNRTLPSDSEVIGAVQRVLTSDATVVCAAGGLPGELHKLWRAGRPGSYHLEYGYSCMGYEIAGGLGVKMALPERNVIVFVGDGSYMMLNSELATSVMLGKKLTVVVLDNRGYGCINRLQRATGSESFNNLLQDTLHEELPELDFVAHARSMGAIAEKVSGIADLEAALARARDSKRTHVVVIDTDPMTITDAGGHWWDVAVPEVSVRPTVRAAHDRYLAATAARDAAG
jgi:3D-(3,5/4)-trihydroxycyclohexane-1,2-dione acylhydrolase (decyclizing)